MAQKTVCGWLVIERERGEGVENITHRRKFKSCSGKGMEVTMGFIFLL
jgi:hypothetical protein